jgi:peptide/nickel transport system substrate-binding protein
LTRPYRQKHVIMNSSAIFLSSILILVSLASVIASAAPEEYVIIKIGTVSQPDSFNPFSMTTDISYTVAGMMYEMLYAVGPDMEPYPQLARECNTSEEGRVWTYNLTEDSVWHDGGPVTAHDVEFTFNMILENEDDCALLGGYLSGVVDVTATDDYTVQITLEEPKATMLAIPVPILPEHLWSSVVAAGLINHVDVWDTDFFQDGPVGSGPMILSEYSKTSGFIRLLKQYPYHRLVGIEVDSINVDEILFVIYGNEASMAAALQTGDIDVIDGAPESLWDTLLQDPDIDGQAPAALDLTDLGFNCASQELRESVDGSDRANFPRASTNLETVNVSVRQAIAMVTNKTLIVEEILMGLGQEADSLIPTATPFWHWYVPEEEKWPVDFEAANDLLNESGYHQFDGSDFGFAGVRENESSDARLEFEFYYISATISDELSACKIADWCEEIGVQLNLHGVSEGTLYNLWFNLEYDMFIWSWHPDVDPAFLLSVLTTQQIPEDSNDITAWSDCFYSNPEYDQLYDDQLLAIDPFERQTIVHEMQRIAYRDCPYICLWYPFSLIAYRTDNFINFPDMASHPGATPSSIWFYFEVTTRGEVYPPFNVYAGTDFSVWPGDTLSFTGFAEDYDDPLPSLNWSWEFIEPDSSSQVLYGQTVAYTFEIPGTVEVILTVADPAGSWDSDSLLVTVVMPPPPETAVTLSGVMGMNGWYRSSVDVTLNATAWAGVESTVYSLNSGDWQTYTGQFAIDTEGNNTLEYYSVDSYGSNETTRMEYVAIDTLAPESSIVLTGIAGSDGWFRSVVNVTLDAEDSTSGVGLIEYALDDAQWTTYDAEFIIDGDGSHALSVRSEDVAGNIEEAQIVNFSIDWTIPNLLIITPLSDASTSSATVSFECHDDSALSTLEIMVDSSVWEVVETNESVTRYDYFLEVSDGLHDLQIRATDPAGNEAIEYVSFTLDTTVPSLQISTPVEGSSIRGNDVVVAWESYDNVLIHVTEINIDGDGWVIVNVSDAGGVVNLELGHGEHTVQLRVTDSAGNENVSSVTFEVNSSALSFAGPYYGLPLIGIIAAMIAAVAVVGNLLRNRRSGPSVPPSESSTDDSSLQP